VVHERPARLTPEKEAKMRERMTFDIDDMSHPFIAAVIADRSETDAATEEPSMRTSGEGPRKESPSS
jgi:hypothetical protein